MVACDDGSLYYEIEDGVSFVDYKSIQISSSPLVCVSVLNQRIVCIDSANKVYACDIVNNIGVVQATKDTFGGLKLGQNLSFNKDTGAVDASGGSYELPFATDTVLGGIKIGANVVIDSGDDPDHPEKKGQLSVPLATASAAGVVIPDGDTITVDKDGKISAKQTEQVNADWNASSGKAQILNKPTIPEILSAGDHISISGGKISAIYKGGHKITIDGDTINYVDSNSSNFPWWAILAGVGLAAGIGKRFANAGACNVDKIRNDITDGVNWAIANKIADRNYIAIMGGSYGGDLALSGLAFTPDVFCCGVLIYRSV